MAQKAIFRFVFDEHVNRLTVYTDYDQEQGIEPKIVYLTDTELTLEFKEFIYVSADFVSGYCFDSVNRSDYSLAFKTDWSIKSVDEEVGGDGIMIRLVNGQTDNSDNCVIEVLSRKKDEVKAVENTADPIEVPQVAEEQEQEPIKEDNPPTTTIDLTKLPKWNELPSGEYKITLRAKAKGKNASGESRVIVVRKP